MLVLQCWNVESTGHNGFSGVLIMPVFIAVPEKLPGQKTCDEEEEHEFLGVLTSF